MLQTLLDFSLLHNLLASLPAYLDPGSGSFILQVLLASLVGIGFAIRAYWGKIKKSINKGTEEDIDEELEETDE